MSTISSITIFGYDHVENRQTRLIPLIQHLGGEIDLMGCINCFYPDEDGDMDCLNIEIGDRDPFELAAELITQRGVKSFDFYLVIEGTIRYFTLSADPKYFSITINSERVTINGTRHTDFTWYHKVFIAKLSDNFIRPYYIEYIDVLG